MLLLRLLFLCVPNVIASQFPIGTGSEAQYSIYRHESSGHVIKIKAQNDTLCDARTKQWTGWLSNGPKHWFFWYFEMSEKSPNEDSLTLWLNGGPGGSSMCGLWMELGPCLIEKEGNSSKHNPFGWQMATSMLFVDQPAGVGFSYTDDHYTPYVDNSFTSASDMTIFLHMFMSKVFPGKANVPLHISGESYAGHYLPALGSEILKHNSFYPDRTRIPLKSLMIGDGALSLLDIQWGYWETLCTKKRGMEKPLFNETICDIMAENTPRCTELMKICTENGDPALCQATEEVCWNGLIKFFDDNAGRKGGRNPFDITRTCEVDNFCYKESDWVETYLNKPEVWKALSVPSVLANFSMANWEVGRAFFNSVDIYIDMLPQVQDLVNNNIDVLLYQGNLDLACNTAGNLRWANKMPWKGQTEFVAKGLVPWTAEIDGKEREVGTFKEVHVKMNKSKVRFAFVTVHEAGHMVPMDQPEVALEMVNRWINGKVFGEQSNFIVGGHDDL